jgi:hypothetical protein
LPAAAVGALVCERSLGATLAAVEDCVGSVGVTDARRRSPLTSRPVESCERGVPAVMSREAEPGSGPTLVKLASSPFSAIHCSSASRNAEAV